MKTASLKFFIVFSLGVYCFVACSEENNKNEKPSVSGPLHVNSITTNLPEAAGYATFQNNCISCHSARYVQMQPDFSEKTWTAIVKKMQKNYGAPISDSAVPEIVQYLVAIKGKS